MRTVGRDAGLDAVGIAGAEPFTEARLAIERARDDRRDGGMQFTYRNPARATDPDRALPGAAALVVGARRYLRRDPAKVSAARPGVAARVARYSWVDHYAPLRRSLERIAERLRAEGWRARVAADDNALVDRAAAHRAGLGWFGRNTNLLLPGAGSWFVLGSVVTDAPLPADQPVAAGCGSCRRCVPACPTGALSDDGTLDGRRCLAWLVQAPGVFPRPYRAALHDRIYGCDTCQEVCPPNRRAERGDPPPPAEADASPWADALEILAASDADLLDRWGRWYIAERDPRHLRRNALIVLGNVGDVADPAVTRALERATGDPDPLLRAHAVWAAARLGRRDLVAAQAADGDPLVTAEVAAAAAVATRSDSGAGSVRSFGQNPARPAPGPSRPTSPRSD